MDPDAIISATRAMCAQLYGDNFDLHDHGSQDPDDRASLERAAEAAVEAYLAYTESDVPAVALVASSDGTSGLAARLRAFGRDCVAHGDMTPMAREMLGKILDEQPGELTRWQYRADGGEEADHSGRAGAAALRRDPPPPGRQRAHR